jgi:DNA-binding CsgD family transcriptional regulator
MREWSRRAALLKVPGRELPDRLTAREAEILRLVALGKTNKEMAAELFLSVHTVERHVQNAYRKISARNRADASTYVARVGL